MWTQWLSSALFGIRVQYATWNVEAMFNPASKGGHSCGVLTVVVLWWSFISAWGPECFESSFHARQTFRGLFCPLCHKDLTAGAAARVPAHRISGPSCSCLCLLHSWFKSTDKGFSTVTFFELTRRHTNTGNPTWSAIHSGFTPDSGIRSGY